MSYQLVGSGPQAVQLKVIELVVAYGDAISTISSNNLIIDCGQPVSSIRCASFFDNSAATSASVVASNQTIGGGNGANTITLALGAAFAANDAVRVCFVVTE